MESYQKIERTADTILAYQKTADDRSWARNEEKKHSLRISPEF